MSTRAIGALAVLIAILLGKPAHASYTIRYAITGPTGKKIEIQANVVPEKVDQAYWQGAARASRFKSRVEEILDLEARYYQGRGYVPVPDGARVPGTRLTIRSNVPSVRTNCAGLSLARLVGGLYNIDPGEAHRLVSSFGRETKQPAPDDLAIWYRSDIPRHVALVVGPNGEVLSKDDKERVYRGQAELYPSGENEKNAGILKCWRLDWRGLKAQTLLTGSWAHQGGTHSFIPNQGWRQEFVLTQSDDRVTGRLIWRDERHPRAFEVDLRRNGARFHGPGSDGKPVSGPVTFEPIRTLVGTEAIRVTLTFPGGAGYRPAQFDRADPAGP